MEVLAKPEPPKCVEVEIEDVPRDVAEWDYNTFEAITSTELTPEQKELIVNPATIYPRQEYVLAVHWHPEFIPMDLIKQRIANMFPNAKDSLIIPTQHNIIMDYDGYSGVEVDCYSSGFNSKVQLLLHFRSENMDKADTLKAMLKHTFLYRSSQLFEFLESLVEPSLEDRRQLAAGQTNTNEELVEFVRIQSNKLKQILMEKQADIPDSAIKNKLVRNYFDAMRALYGDRLINRAQVFIKAVKDVVKEHFSLAYFYKASQVIEEARGIGAGVVIPHPEQFWPILLANYNVDGYEVWNPQSQRYTEFLVNVVTRQNERGWHAKRPLLIFMGDDCHMSEKVKKPEEQKPEKASREIGYQPAWDDPAIRKSLIMYGVNRKRAIEEYKERLS